MKLKFLSSLLAALLLPVMLCAAEIASVRFEQKGANPLPEDMLKMALRLRKGMEFNDRHLAEDVRNLYAAGGVTDVAPEVITRPDGKVEIIYRVVLSPVISVFKITGNAKFDTKDIQKQLKIADGERLNSRALSESIENVRKFYVDKGYTDVRIDPPSIVPDGKGGVIVTMTIKENLRLKVHDVKFTGAKLFSQRELRSSIANAYSYWNLLPFINNYLNHGLLDRNELKIDKARLRQLYQDKGYLDFTVKDIKLTPTAKDPEFVDIEFIVDEGKPYTVDKVTVSGAAAVDRKLLEKTLKVVSGKTFSAADETATIKAMSQIYDVRGYADAVIRPVRKEDYPNHKVSVDFTVSEGRKYHVRDVVIVGNTYTKDKVIRRELAIQPGDPVARNRIDISRQRLLGMGYFTKVDADSVNADALDEKDVRITVEEKPDRYHFRIGAGASDINSIFGMAEISTNNFDIANPKNWFYGGGQRLRLQAIYGAENAGFNLDFVEPWLFDLPLRFELSGYLTQASYEDWEERRLGVRTSIQRKIFDDFTTVTLGYKFEYVRVGDVSKEIEDFMDDEDMSGGFLVSQPSLMLSRDTRDSLVNPTEGYFLNLFGSLTPKALGSSKNYYRLEGKGSYHVSFFDKAIIAMVGAKIGVVAGFDTNENVPAFERYLLGGGDSIRGFDYRSIGPTVNDKNIGGQTMLLFTAEVSHPIWGPLRGAVFADAGNAWLNPYDINFSGMNMGIGYGFRLKLPMINAPLKIDLAYPVIKSQDDIARKLRIHFNVGFTF